MMGSKTLFYLFLIFIMLGKESYSGESSTYNFSWLDPDKEVYVLQNRKFRKKRSLFLKAGFGKSLSGSFVDSTQLQARAGFFFKEEYGVGVLYSKNNGKANETSETVGKFISIPFVELPKTTKGSCFFGHPFTLSPIFLIKFFITILL